MPREFEPLSHRIIEAAIDVHRQPGPGFLESIYENAMRVALTKRALAFESQRAVQIVCEGVDVGFHRLDSLSNAKSSWN